MSLDHLDDPNPPEFDATRWQRVTLRSRAIVRRRRSRRGSASLAVIVAIGLGAVWSISGPDDRRGVRVLTPDTTTTTTRETTTTRLDPSAWVTVGLELDRPQRVFAAGEYVTGTVVFHNHRTLTVQLPASGCARLWSVAVGTGDARPIVGFRGICSIPQKFAAGTTRRPFRARTTYLTCAGTSSPTFPLPKCLPNGGGVPPLPVGPAKVWFISDGPIEHLVAPAPIAIQLVLPPA